MNLAALNKAVKRTQFKPDDEHDLLALATMGHASLAGALHLWESSVPADMKGMLTLSQGWRWDRETQGYRAMSGRFVRDVELKELALAIAAALKKKHKHLLLMLLIGQLPILVWRHQTAAEITALYILMGALGSGGFFHLKPAVRKIITGHPDRPPGLLYTLARLRVFARKLEDEREKKQTREAVTAPLPGLEHRMGMYIDSAQTIYEESRRESHVEEAKRTGVTLEERNILGDADHCTTTNGVVGCPEWSKRGWLPAGTMTPPGCRPCLVGCRCRISLRFV